MIPNIVFYTALIIVVFMGFLVFVKKPKDQGARLFLYTCIIFASWMIFNFSVDVVSNLEQARILARLDFAFASIFSFIFILFCFVFPNDKFPGYKKFIGLLVLPLFFCIASLSNLIVRDVKMSGSGYDIEYGLLEIPYDIFIFAYILVGGVGRSFLKFRKATGAEKAQLLYVLIGFFFLTFIEIIANIVLPLFWPQVPTISRIGYFGIMVWAFFTAYAIIKHRLFDIRVILTETATVIVVLALLIQALLSKTVSGGLTNGAVLIFVTYGGYLLIKSVQEEIRKKEQLQDLMHQLAHANVHLQELDKMKTEFVSLASHELLTPVSAIEGYLSMMLDEKLAKVDDPKAIHYMDRVYRSAKRLARLVTDMLNVSRIEEGRLLIEKKDVNLTEIIGQTVDELHFKAEEQKQKVVFENPNRWATFGDVDKLKEVLVNLIGNSIKYSKDPGTITVTVETVPTAVVQDKWSKIESEIKAGPLDDQEAIKSAVDERLKRLVGEKQILIHVKDQGIGIPAEELPKLFKKFHRVGDYTTAESQGTGLGLYISRALVELHHGRIWAASEGHSHGSTFTFSLPEFSSKKAIEALEAQVPKTKEALKPLAQPPKEAEEL